jgi:hypothetical protein
MVMILVLISIVAISCGCGVLLYTCFMCGSSHDPNTNSENYKRK